MDGLFNTVGGITMLICGIGGFGMILWIMSHAHSEDHSHPPDSNPKTETNKNTKH